MPSLPTKHDFDGRAIRVVELDGEPWFIATDAARELGHRDAEKLTRTLDDDEKGTHTVGTPGGQQTLSVISEAGLYRAIVQRRATSEVSDEVRERIARFQRFVFHDVLPAIRRTGGYTLPAAPVAPLPPPAVASAFKSFFGIGRLIGLDRNQAALSANRATVASTGVDALALMGHTALVAPQQAPALTPTEIGRELGGLSALKVNAILAELGLQEGRRDARDRAYWIATAAGEPYAVYLDTGKAHGDGTPIRQLKWAATVVPLVRDLCTPAAGEA